MELVLYNPRTISVPVYGQIAAGKPLDESPIIGWRTIREPNNYKPHDRYCAVIINGDSLIEAHILSGDYAILRLSARLDHNGQLAAVLIPGGMAMKYIFGRDGRVMLRSASPHHPDRWLDDEEVRVQGVVIRIERDL